MAAGLDARQRRSARVRPLASSRPSPERPQSTSPARAAFAHVRARASTGTRHAFVDVLSQGRRRRSQPRAGWTGPWLGATRATSLQRVANRPIVCHVLDALCWRRGWPRSRSLAPRDVAGEIAVPACDSEGPAGIEIRVTCARAAGRRRRGVAGGAESWATRRASCTAPTACWAAAARRCCRCCARSRSDALLLVARRRPRQQATVAGAQRLLAPPNGGPERRSHPGVVGRLPARPGRAARRLATCDGSSDAARPRRRWRSSCAGAAGARTTRAAPPLAPFRRRRARPARA